MSLENIKDILARRVDQFDSGDYDIMTEAKLVILEVVKAEVRIVGLKHGVLRVATEDAPAASEIRLHTRAILAKINDKIKPNHINRITVVIR